MRRLVLLAVVLTLLIATAAQAFPLAPPNPTTATTTYQHTATLTGETLPAVSLSGTLAGQDAYQVLACRRTSNRTYCSWVYHYGATVTASCAWCWIPPSSSTIGGYYGRTYASCSGTDPALTEACAWNALRPDGGRQTMLPGDYVNFALELQGHGSLVISAGDGSAYTLTVP